MLKPYDISYTERCVDLFIDVFTNEPFKYSWMRRDNMTRYFTDIRNTPGFTGAVALEDGRLVGFCVGIVNDYFSTRNYEIKEIVVARDLQGKGYGGRLLTEIEDYLA